MTELQKIAFKEGRRKELEINQRVLDIQWLNNRMENGRMGRFLALVEKEAEMEKDFQERTDHAAIVNARAEKEIKLGIEVAKVKREEECALLRAHYLRERDPSLRNLTQKLQAGYVCRDLKQQILDNQHRRLQEKAEEYNANSVLMSALYNDDEMKKKEDKEKMERNTQYCKEIQQQLVNRHKQKQCQYEDTLIEKKMLEDIMRTLADEDQRELDKKKLEAEKLRKEMVTFQKARDAWKEKQKQAIVLEEKQIEEQMKASNDRNSAVVAEKERRMRLKEEYNKKMGDKILADEAARQQREDIIQMLQEQEYLEKNFQDDIAASEKAERVKRQAKEGLISQIENRRRIAEEQKKLEIEYRKETGRKLAVEEEKARETAMKIKEKRRKHSKDLLEQIQENSRRRKKEQDLETAMVQNLRKYDNAWREEVSNERKQIISEHVPQVLGYLQAGVISAEDLPAVREGANRREHLAKLDIESLATPRGAQHFPKCNAQCKVLREY